KKKWHWFFHWKTPPNESDSTLQDPGDDERVNWNDNFNKASGPHGGNDDKTNYPKTDGVNPFAKNLNLTGKAAGGSSKTTPSASSDGVEKMYAAAMGKEMENSVGANSGQSKGNQNATSGAAADNLAAMERYYAAAAIEWVKNYVYNFTTDGGNQ